MSNLSSDINYMPWQAHYGPKTNKELESFEYTSLADMVAQNSIKWATNTAYTMVLPNGMSASLTYEKTEELSDNFAVYLKEKIGLKQNDRVVMQMPNCLAYPIAVFGVLKAGGVVVNTNPLYTSSEMQYQFHDCEAKVLIIVDMFADKLVEAIHNTNIETVILVSIVDLFPFVKKNMVKTILKYVKRQIPPCTIDFIKFENAVGIGEQIKKLNHISTASYWKDIKLDDLCALQYTGGTTGISKAAMLTHGNILANMYQIYEMGKTKIEFGKECILTVLPLYHIFAFTVNLISFYNFGGESLLIPNPRPLINIKKALDMSKITWITGVNTLFNGLLNEPWFTKSLPKCLKASIAGGSALHSAVAERWKKMTKTLVVEGYGLTETSPVVTFNPIDGMVKADTVGIPVPSTKIILIDDNGNVTLEGPGEIAIQGPQVMKGYWNRPDETAKVFKDGWLLTGDVGVMDKDGYIKIVDRKKDMILVSGFNVYPNEVEDCISQLSGVQEVAVIGVPSGKTGESVKAFVVKKDPLLTEEQITEHCKQYLTHYKLPKQIEFRKELPKSPIGKILRKELRLPPKHN
ncbi:MAG: AMP-binding protein [Bdellovibrionota bacterium]